MIAPEHCRRVLCIDREHSLVRVGCESLLKQSRAVTDRTDTKPAHRRLTGKTCGLVSEIPGPRSKSASQLVHCPSPLRALANLVDGEPADVD
jgi:hypothetical protein